jgi:predicted metal-dependent hydrolase
LPDSIATGPTAVWHGADLFDHGAFWEAHAIWEAVWRVHPKGSDVHEGLQALIQAAAYHLKTEPDQARAAHRLRTRALMRLDQVCGRGTTHLYGLDLVAFREALHAHRPGDAPLRLQGGPPADTDTPSMERTP